MKITKRKWENKPPVFFYRDDESGKLITQGSRHDQTDILFREESSVSDVFEKSLQNRLLKMQKDGKRIKKNEITELVACLCKSTGSRNNACIESIINKIQKLSPGVVTEKCNETLSEYGKCFAAEGSNMTLYKALLYLIDGNDIEKAMAKAGLVKIQQALQKEREYRKRRVFNSIKKNKIPLIVKDDGTIEANNDRTAWLLELLTPVKSSSEDHDYDFYPVLTEIKKIISYERLSNDIKKQIEQCDGKARSIAKAADEVLKKHLKDLWERYPENHRNMKYYFQAVHEYFKDNFPIKAKMAGAKKRQELLTKDKAALLRLLEPDHIAKTVHRKLINQSTQMHILYGKLYEYCCKGDNKLPVNSDTLQLIQVSEAVKKQVMTAVLWSISRLKYFYEYYDGDILSEHELVKEYRRKFLVVNKQYTNDFVQACKEKIKYFFPLEEIQERYGAGMSSKYIVPAKMAWDDREICNKLLAECVFCVNKLRTNIFHYKNMSLTQMLKNMSDEVGKELIEKGSILLQLYINDVENRNKAFAQRIRSMNLPLYYSKDLLNRIFTKYGAEFTLYSPNNQMTPSFRRVYEKGKNLRKEYERKFKSAHSRKQLNSESEYILRWFRQHDYADEAAEAGTRSVSNSDSDIDIETGIIDYIDESNEIDSDDYSSESENINDVSKDIDTQRVIRNLLQLIYKHQFLPEVLRNETIVTGKIRKVLDRNRMIADERSKFSAARNFGYSAVEEIYHDGITLAELLKELQRKISETEKENKELERSKTDYVQRFIRELFAVAFESFMNEQYGEVYDEIMHPKRNEDEAKKWSEESVKLGTSLNESKTEGYLLVFYTVMRLLDENELSELQQQMLRYRASMSRWNGETDFDEDVKIIEKIEELAELVKLTEPVPSNTEVWNKRIKEEIKQLIEGDLTDYGEFYLQSDKTSPVLRRNMMRLIRSGITEVYKKVLHNQKQATRRDYDVYCRSQHENLPGINSVEQAQKVLQQLHRTYAVSPSNFSADDYRKYKNILQWLEEYNRAVRNLSFETLYEVCVINMEILSRWIGLIQDWERDMYFILLAWVKQGKLYGLTEKDVTDIFERGRVVGRLKKKLKGNNMAAFMSIYRTEKDDKDMEFAEVRNRIAHLELLRESGWSIDTKDRDLSVIEWYLNKLRLLLSYDQKRMNAVSSVMKTIFQKHNTEAVFRIERGGELKFDSVKPVMIEHLKDSEFKKGINVPSRGKTFLNDLERLMKYKDI